MTGMDVVFWSILLVLNLLLVGAIWYALRNMD